jgi:uncharacterized damage-inducible protein DinB
LSNEQKNADIFVATALNAWDQWVGRADKLFASLSDEQMKAEIAPGKNRPVYLLGHLIAVNDAMIPQLRLGEARYPELWTTFVKSPDRSVDSLPSIAELRDDWSELNARLSASFRTLSPEQWLERHSTISDEDFAKEPHRNRLAILLSRTSHNSYHMGQLALRSK